MHQQWAQVGLAPELIYSGQGTGGGLPGNYACVVMQDLEVEGYKRVSLLSKDEVLLAKNIALGLMEKVPAGTGEQEPVDPEKKCQMVQVSGLKLTVIVSLLIFCFRGLAAVWEALVIG